MSATPTENKVTLTEDRDDFIIELPDEGEIGYIRTDGNYITQMEIQVEYRGEGYGTQALQELIRIFETSPVTKLETSAVISPEMETILRKNRFSRCEHEESHWFREV